MKGPHMQFNRWCDKTKQNSYGSYMNVNVEENPIQICSKIRAQSHYGIKCGSFDCRINCFLIRAMHKAKKRTQLNHCILWRVSGCNLTNDMTKQQNTYSSHLNKNKEENAIQMCSKIRAPSHYSLKWLNITVERLEYYWNSPYMKTNIRNNIYTHN